jgi:hypothetical protein
VDLDAQRVEIRLELPSDPFQAMKGDPAFQ